MKTESSMWNWKFNDETFQNESLLSNTEDMHQRVSFITSVRTQRVYHSVLQSLIKATVELSSLHNIHYQWLTKLALQITACLKYTHMTHNFTWQWSKWPPVDLPIHFYSITGSKVDMINGNLKHEKKNTTASSSTRCHWNVRAQRWVNSSEPFLIGNSLKTWIETRGNTDTQTHYFIKYNVFLQSWRHSSNTVWDKRPQLESFMAYPTGHR